MSHFHNQNDSQVKHIFTTEIKYSSAYYILCLHTTSCFLIASLILWSPIGQFMASCLPLDVEPVNLRGYFGSFEVARREWQRYSVSNMEAKHRWYPRSSRPEPWKSPLWAFTASLSCFWRSASESCWPGSRRTDAVWPTCSNTRSIGWGARLIFHSTPRNLPFPKLSFKQQVVLLPKLHLLPFPLLYIV